MTVLMGDSGLGMVGPLKTFTITPSTPRETLLGTPLTLPTTEPATAQVSFTLQQSDLPVITPSVPFNPNTSIVCSGKAPTGASISYRVLKNGVSVNNGTNATTLTNNFWTNTFWAAWNAQVGDLIEIKLWSNQSDTYLDFYALVCYHTEPEFTKRGTLLKELSFPSYTTTSTNIFSSFSNTSPTTATSNIYPAYNSTNIPLGVSHIYPFVIPNPSQGMYRANAGQGNTATNYVGNATNRNYQKLNHPLTVQFREVNLR